MKTDSETSKWAGKQMIADGAGIGLIIYGTTLLESGETTSGAVTIILGLVVSFIRHLI